MTPTQEIKDRFISLLNRLSPENLSCDGELSPAMVRKEYKKLRREWKILENSVGQIVTEDEVTNWIVDEVREALINREIINPFRERVTTN